MASVRSPDRGAMPRLNDVKPFSLAHSTHSTNRKVITVRGPSGRRRIRSTCTSRPSAPVHRVAKAVMRPSSRTTTSGKRETYSSSKAPREKRFSLPLRCVSQASETSRSSGSSGATSRGATKSTVMPRRWDLLRQLRRFTRALPVRVKSASGTTASSPSLARLSPHSRYRSAWSGSTL